MYESPIELLTSTYLKELSNKQDEEILQCVIETGVKVDKEELIKALAYDRNQYDVGYSDAMAAIVWCKDCKHFTAGYCCRDIKGRSQMHYMGENAFCSYGERKDGADNE